MLGLNRGDFFLLAFIESILALGFLAALYAFVFYPLAHIHYMGQVYNVLYTTSYNNDYCSMHISNNETHITFSYEIYPNKANAMISNIINQTETPYYCCRHACVVDWDNTSVSTIR